jgi:hypothetical protein
MIRLGTIEKNNEKARSSLSSNARLKERGLQRGTHQKAFKWLLQLFVGGAIKL